VAAAAVLAGLGAAPAAAATPIALAPAAGALPNGIVGSAYGPRTITATGGSAPYTFAVTAASPSTALPPGITFTPNNAAGTLAVGGTPTTVGNYSFTVKASDTAGDTDATAVYTLAVGAVAPSAPTIGTATAGPGDQQATVAFTPPASTGDGNPIAHYTATSNTGGHTGTCTSSPCTVSGLTDGTAYTFTVTATNTSSLTSAASAASNSVTPKKPQTITFANPGTQTIGTTPTLTASASSGLTVAFTSSTTTICTVGTGFNANKLTLVAPGTCTINANQAGNTTYLAAPQVTQSFTVQKPGSTVTVTSSTANNASVFGQQVTFTATFNPAVTGQVQWSVGGTNVGSPVTMTNSTTSTLPIATLPVGSDVVKATYLGDTNHASVNGQVTQTVSKASTATTVQVSGNTVTATVKPVAPGAGTPTGTVTFTVNGATAGTAPVGTGGVATLTVTSTDVGQHAVSATYGGDTNFSASTGNRTPIGPTVVAHLTSKYPKRAGWHRSPVYVFFSCTPNTAPLVGACPGTITVSSNGAGQRVSVTVTATDGGSTTVTVSGINVDQVPPRLAVRRHGHQLLCNASDALSGVASCVILRHLHVKGSLVVVNWTAVAHDRAGNTTVKHGGFSYAR
jgi:hypothetical protein